MLDFQKDYSFFQDGKKLLEAVMQGNAPRLPVFAQMHEYAIKEIGANAAEFYSMPGQRKAGDIHKNISLMSILIGDHFINSIGKVNGSRQSTIPYQADTNL